MIEIRQYLTLHQKPLPMLRPDQSEANHLDRHVLLIFVVSTSGAIHDSHPAMSQYAVNQVRAYAVADTGQSNGECVFRCSADRGAQVRTFPRRFQQRLYVGAKVRMRSEEIVEMYWSLVRRKFHDGVEDALYLDPIRSRKKSRQLKAPSCRQEVQRVIRKPARWIRKPFLNGQVSRKCGECIRYLPAAIRLSAQPIPALPCSVQKSGGNDRVGRALSLFLV